MNTGNLFVEVIKETYGGVPYCEEITEDWLKVITSAKKEFFKAEVVKHLRLKMMAEELGEGMKKIKYENKRMLKKILEIGASERNTLYLWITINPKKDVKLDKFLNQLNKYATRKMFLEYMYVVEQRGDTESDAGKGFHAHMLLKRDVGYKPSKVIKNSKNTWKNMTDVENPSIFNFNWCPEEFIKDKKEYMSSGGKTGENKDTKQTIDILWRKKNNIKSFYKSEGHE